MARAGISPLAITTILVSHFHLDHVGDLAPILFALRNPRFDAERRWPRIVGPRGMGTFYAQLRALFRGWLPEPGRDFELCESTGEAVRCAGFRLRAFPVVHTENSVAYRIEDDSSATICWSGDTETCDGIVEAARDADLLLLECSFPRGKGVKGHLDPDGVLEIVRAARPRRTVLMHFYPECDEVNLREQLEGETAASISIGADLEEYRVSRPL